MLQAVDQEVKQAGQDEGNTQRYEFSLCVRLSSDDAYQRIMNSESTVWLDVTPCNLVDSDQCFGGTFCRHLQEKIFTVLNMEAAH